MTDEARTPVATYDVPLRPDLIITGRWPEHLIVTPLLLATLGWLIYRDIGAGFTGGLAQ
jgi:hypothetical protein